MKIWFTIAGTRHYYGQDFLKKGMKIQLEKELDNKYDSEAIKVILDGVGQIGYVANSPYTRIGESWSAGRIYDKIDYVTEGKVKLVLDKGVLCILKIHEKENKVIPPVSPDSSDNPGKRSRKAGIFSPENLGPNERIIGPLY